MNRIPETDQWLLNGDCDKCRRKKYCNKQCTENKRYNRRAFSSLVMSVAADVLTRAAKEEPMFPGKPKHDIG